METRVSFFIVAGFLVPGIVFGFALAPLALELVSKNGLPTWLSALPLADSNAVAVSAITFFGFGSLACAFSVGIFLSDLYFKLIESVRFLREPDRKIFKELSSDTLREFLAKDWRLQEAYVISLTQGPDVYGYAARNRMLGASGFAILTAGVIYLCSGWFMFAGALTLLGLMFIVTGASLARRYREWIAAYAALFIVTGRMVKVTAGAIDEKGE
jgi:hypothetical protein